MHLFVKMQYPWVLHVDKKLCFEASNKLQCLRFEVSPGTSGKPVKVRKNWLLRTLIVFSGRGDCPYLSPDQFSFQSDRSRGQFQLENLPRKLTKSRLETLLLDPFEGVWSRVLEEPSEWRGQYWADTSSLFQLVLASNYCHGHSLGSLLIIPSNSQELLGFTRICSDLLGFQTPNNPLFSS